MNATGGGAHIAAIKNRAAGHSPKHATRHAPPFELRCALVFQWRQYAATPSVRGKLHP
jgi:hypothetical protein